MFKNTFANAVRQSELRGSQKKFTYFFVSPVLQDRFPRSFRPPFPLSYGYSVLVSNMEPWGKWESRSIFISRLRGLWVRIERTIINI